MSSSIQEQLSALPIASLTTVLRVRLPLRESDSAFVQAGQMIEAWWNRKAAPYAVTIDKADFSFSQGNFKLDFVRTDTALALAMEEPDATQPLRTWIVDIALDRNEDAGQPEFFVRLSFRQPRNLLYRPDPRAPRFLRDLVDKVGAVDFASVTSSAKLIEADNLTDLVGLIQAQERGLPVVVVSTVLKPDKLTHEPLVDPGDLAGLLAGTAHVCTVGQEASWGLSRTWTNEWSAYNGAVRCYNAFFDPKGNKYQHKLWQAEAIRRLDARSQNGFINACVGHVFAQVTADFEATTLRSPAILRRQLIEETTAKLHSAPNSLSAERKHLGAKSSLDEIVENETDNGSPAEAKLLSENTSLRDENARLSQDVVDRERDLQEERAGRAESEKDLKSTLSMYEDEVQTLTQKLALLGESAVGSLPPTLVPVWQSFAHFSDSFTNALINVSSQFKRLEHDADVKFGLEQELSTVKETIVNQNAKIGSLSRKQSTLDRENWLSDETCEVVRAFGGKNPSLEASLKLIAAIRSQRLVVLESALDSARESSNFRLGGQAFDRLWTLVNKYWDQLIEKGDSSAHSLFGKDGYAPKESVKLTKQGEARRTFEYSGQRIFMPRHLKIGTAENSADTVRIHFEWIPDESRFVIGHCGRHLDF